MDSLQLERASSAQQVVSLLLLLRRQMSGLESVSSKLGLERRETSVLQVFSCNEGIKTLTEHFWKLLSCVQLNTFCLILRELSYSGWRCLIIWGFLACFHCPTPNTVLECIEMEKCIIFLVKESLFSQGNRINISAVRCSGTSISSEGYIRVLNCLLWFRTAAPHKYHIMLIICILSYLKPSAIWPFYKWALLILYSQLELFVYFIQICFSVLLGSPAFSSCVLNALVY